MGILVVTSTSPHDRTAMQIAAAVLVVLDAFSICLLSWLEHSRSLRPSSLLGTYLLFTLLLDCARTRTAWRLGNRTSGSLLATSDIVKFILIFLEARQKQSSFSKGGKEVGPEDTSGMYSRSLFWWLNGLLRSGFGKNTCAEGSIPNCSRSFARECCFSFRRGLVYLSVSPIQHNNAN